MRSIRNCRIELGKHARFASRPFALSASYRRVSPCGLVEVRLHLSTLGRWMVALLIGHCRRGLATGVGQPQKMWVGSRSISSRRSSVVREGPTLS